MAAMPALGCPVAEARRRAMGSDAHLAVTADERGRGDELVAAGWSRIDELEARWSRFRPDSEVSRLNRHAGRPVTVSTDTVELVRHALLAWQLTDGLFDPTVGAALVAQGYDRDFAEIAERTSHAGDPAPVPGPAGLVLDPQRRSVTLPAGVVFDPGGIGKGLAADFVAEALVGAGAAGALVNLGGDLRALGHPPGPEGWVVTLPDPMRPGAELARLALPWGAVATTSRLRRRWRAAGGEAHHLIDPTTGRPADSGVVSVTVVADRAWRAEAFTKALFLAGGAGLAGWPGIHALVVTDDGRAHASPGLEGALR